ncbi:hypothetical protein FDJ25_gp169 [Vibrio phage Aphrodite1]|uniref:Uncharacterized protein n=1 Tax=Vibrio phage Aphrodite1 TaxID=2070057 RepID=A0A2I7QI80_9CAUD|nr:hypothetical protein FDJ25_gp169 [Vibrio phage Aphrodite1]AUR81100.1 hypothetical protein Aphrodite1_0032 [Vibrio phage Aphrodite1]
MKKKKQRKKERKRQEEAGKLLAKFQLNPGMLMTPTQQAVHLDMINPTRF